MDPGPRRSSLPPVVTVANAGSTQRDLLAVVGDEDAWPHLAALRALRQSAGVGRTGRSWETARLEALTASIVLRPGRLVAPVPRERWGWLAMLAGLAVRDALADRGATAALKWPNDVVVAEATAEPGWGRWRKVAGVLAQVDVGGEAVVVGVGVNLAGQVPVPWAGTAADAGVVVDPGDLLDDVRTGLARLLLRPSGWHDRVSAVCVTLSQHVRVERPGGEVVTGEATGLGDDGALLVRAQGGEIKRIDAGDVQRLRTPAG